MFAFVGLGGTDEVGASSYLYLLKEGNLLIDAGLRPGQVGEAALPQLERLQEHPPSAMVLTHAHLDHVAALPVVTRRYPKLPVYCTEATARIAALVLADTLKVSTEQGYPMFSAGEMKRSLERLRPIPYFQRVSDHGFAFELYPSGHLLGAASVLIMSGGRTVFHTGDVSNVDTPVVNAAWLPAQVTAVDAVVSESTYGDTLLPSRKEQVRTFVAAIGETLRAGGRVLIPSFALGRAQEITQILHTAMASGLLPAAPIHLDGLTRSMTQAYEDMLPLLPKPLQNRRESSGQPVFLSGTVHLVSNRQDRERIIASDQAAVVVASSGMLHAGASPQYARAWLPHPENALFVVGYQDAESPGRRLLELQQGGDVSLPDSQGGRELIPAYARVERFYLSAHADRGGLLGMIARYSPGKVLLTHGELGPRANLAGYLNSKYEVSLPEAGEVVELQDSGRRRGSFLNTAPRKLEALKERHARGKVDVRYDATQHQVVIQLPQELDGQLFGEGEYTLEVLRGKLSRIKLRERDQEALAGMEDQADSQGPIE
ncbi:MBL fold metallo-hydrolase [Deinococcus sp. RIT780]|uniref:MBL fold metallo-hydrolase n=1 Tax=Deinococcus sp. RIT780 TaxID=2870472 RepID=UPI001C8AC3A5|nr:MBL fold metallo-hydrolase [Deinococcus sp. RIT780]MBX8465000.1 MBL fold metallo-hydrolase [Deinococcus sp. RIT780]